ncbi:LysE family translocator [uncultured Shewanella sp.]|uniref:LysE family translocator n=1 Tax=uncultured Shewanella sp. TaxID=173975 RepID=UPI0026199C85|nr:LysE family translocator [uncultured Shewanella sp.]
MMIEIWSAFVLAVVVFCIIPGPTVILVMGQAMAHGKKSVVPLVLGVLSGDFVAMSLSLLGLGVVLATSAQLFLILKWFGVCYLLYLGYKTLTAQIEPEGDDTAKVSKSGLSMFKDAFLVTALNPKDIVFFVAFLPQFITPFEPITFQLVVLMFTFLSIVALNITFYTFFAGAMRERIKSVSAKRWFNCLGGSALMAAAGITASMQRV